MDKQYNRFKDLIIASMDEELEAPSLEDEIKSSNENLDFEFAD